MNKILIVEVTEDKLEKLFKEIENLESGIESIRVLEKTEIKKLAKLLKEKGNEH